jgi:TrmH family RNA methyltransferase
MAELIISSKDNQYVKLARGLAQKKQREQARLFLAEGRSNIREALRSDLQLAFMLYDAAREDEAPIAELLQAAREKGCRLLAVESRLFAGLCLTDASQGLLLAVRRPEVTEASFMAAAKGKNIAVLDGLQDPGNVGTILRTAWAAGLGGVLLVGESADVYNPKVVRAAMGALYHLPVLALADEAAWQLVRELGCELAVADAGGEDFRSTHFDVPVAWLMGREAVGPSAFWRSRAGRVVAIPMQEGVDSLNVAVAAGILFFSATK